MKHWLTTSLSNLAGFIIGVGFVAALTIATQSEGGYLWPYANWLARLCQAFLGPVQFSVVLGAIISLVVSFIVSHVIEKLWRK